jgi:hydrogenase maturation factor HypF (carbamoyltransferase family)
VYRLAGAFGVGGFVQDTSEGVVIGIEGPAHVLDRLVSRLSADAPVLARIARITSCDIPVRGSPGFVHGVQATYPSSRATRKWSSAATATSGSTESRRIARVIEDDPRAPR